jgi:hypothetical protein
MLIEIPLIPFILETRDSNVVSMPPEFYLSVPVQVPAAKLSGCAIIGPSHPKISIKI